MKNKLWIFAVLLAAAIGVASPIHVFNSGETITSADMNSNFAHIHNLMVGGHGPRLMNSDVSAAAAIAHTKLASPGLVPKIWGQITIAGAAGTVTEQGVTGSISSITYTGAGSYVVNIPARTNSNFAVILSATGPVADVACHGWNASTTTIQVRCINAAAGAVDSNFSVLVLDAE